MRTEDAIAKFEAFSLDELRSGLSSWDWEGVDAGVKDAAVESTIRWTDELRRGVVETLKTLDTDEDAEMSLAIHYAEFKSKWISFNTKMNYTIFKAGAPDPNDVFRGNAVWALNTVIMDLLTSGDIDKIDEFLSQPISQAA